MFEPVWQGSFSSTVLNRELTTSFLHTLNTLYLQMKKNNLLARKRNPKTTKINFTTEITVHNSYSALKFTERPTPVPEDFKFEPIFLP